MAVYLSLGDDRGPTVRVHEEIAGYLLNLQREGVLDFSLLLELDPYGDRRPLSPKEIDRLHEGAELLERKLTSFSWEEPLPPELDPPVTVNEEIDPEPWGRDGALRFADEVRALAHAARQYGVPLIAHGD